LNLVEKLQTGDRSAIGEVVTQHLPTVRAMLRHQFDELAKPDDLDDVLQDAVIRLWDKRQVLHAQSNIRGLLYVIARNALIDLWRFRARERDVLKDAGRMPPVESPVTEKQRGRVQQAIREALTDVERQVVMSWLEASDPAHWTAGVPADLARTPGHLRVILHRSFGKLREYLKTESSQHLGGVS
jgi:RNA polymerase sigma factor (sigma-70 family)